MASHPLAEVFGFPPTDNSEEARRHRQLRLCPFNNKVPNCTKDKASDPLGVCSIHAGGETVITCPVRFRERWLVAEDAARFFFAPNTRWTTLSEVRLNGGDGRSAGNIDLVVCALDERGAVIDFGALEIQAVYISGNVRDPFRHFIEDPVSRSTMDWRGQPNYPRPDYLSSSRKRLAPQLIYKGGILKAWHKKTAVALNRSFFNTLAPMPPTSSDTADIAWLVYDLVSDPETNRYHLNRSETFFTEFHASLDAITKPSSSDIGEFMSHLQAKVDRLFEQSSEPVVRTLAEEDDL